MDFLAVFLEEANEHLLAFEDALLELESNPENKEQIDTAFRAIHTIKGSAGMVGLDHVSYFTHDIETLLDRIRNNEIALSEHHISLFLIALDHIKQLISEPVTPDVMLISEKILADVKACQTGSESQQTKLDPGELDLAPNAQSEDQQPAPGSAEIWRIKLIPHQSSFTEGFDTYPIIRELSELGTHNIAMHLDEAQSLEGDPKQCISQFTVLLEGSVDQTQIDDVFMFVEDDWSIDVQPLTLEEITEERLGDILIENGLISQSKLEQALNPAPKIGEQLAQSGVVDSTDVNNALKQQEFAKQQKAEKTETSAASVKVPADKLDALMNLVGELVIMQSSISQRAHETQDTKLMNSAEELSRLTTELRDNTFNIRMLAIGSTFSRFRRLVRDLSQELNKKVKLTTTGADTELDKMVLERLSDPLIHIIRNSLDHGIETPAVRVEKGKPEQGTIALNAGYEEGLIKIQIVDDGAGLNTDRILNKAIENGLIKDRASLTDEQVHQLIFEPGFSTAAQVTDISGRGVGMDVVRTSIESLQGNVKVTSNEQGGTTVTILLPMTLAIIEGLMVQSCDQFFIVPLNSVVECIEIDSQSTARVELVRSRDKMVPCLRLRNIFNLSKEPAKLEQIIVLQTPSGPYGLIVDDVIGQHQTVIKQLGALYKETPGILGATIRGNGDVALIIDVNQLLSVYQVQETNTSLVESAPC